MPYLSEMDRIVRQKKNSGTVAIRLFVPKATEDVSFDDMARDFRQMELSRLVTPYRAFVSV